MSSHTDEDTESFLDMSTAALYQLLMGEVETARSYLDSLSFYEIGQVERGCDRLRQIARELLAKRVKT